MIAVRERGIGSLADPRSAPVLAARLSRALHLRLRRSRGLFITLTYDRGPYADGRECYEAGGRLKHVAKFMARLARVVGVSLRGRWVAKLEFQAGGWPHYHVIVEGVTYVDRGALARAWGHGFVDVRALTGRRIKYFCKYIAKAVDLPAWVLLLPTRALKVVRTSPGFWRRSPRAGSGSVWRQRVSAYVALGQAIAAREGVIDVRSGERRSSAVGDFGELLECAFVARVRVERVGSWWCLDVESLEELARLFNEGEWVECPVWGMVKRPWGPEGPPRPIDLKSHSNRYSDAAVSAYVCEEDAADVH